MTTTPLVIQARIEDALTPGLKKQAEAMNVLRNEIDDVTDQLKLFGERGNQMANALEEIGDPLERVRLGQQYLNRELEGGGGAFARANDAAAKLKVQWESLGVVGQGLVTGIAAAAVAIGTAYVAAVTKAIEADQEMSAQLALTKRAAEDLAVSIGGTGAGEATGALRLLEDAMNGARDLIDATNDSLDKAAEKSWLAAKATDGLKSGFIALLGPIGQAYLILTKIGEAYDEIAGSTDDATSALLRNARAQIASEKDAKARADFEARVLAAERGRQAGVQFSGGKVAPEGGVPTNDREQRLAALDERINAKRREIRSAEFDEAAIIDKIGRAEAVRLGLVEAGKAAESDRLGIYKQVDAAVAQIEAREARILDLVGKSAEKARGIAGRAPGLTVEHAGGAGLGRIDAAAEKMAQTRAAMDLDADKALQTKAFADAAAFAEPWIAASTAIQNGFIGIGTSAITMGVMVAQGTATLGDMGRAFAQQLGGLFVQFGSGLAAAGFGELALFSGDPAGAIAWGIGLAAIGAAIQGFASGSPKKRKSGPSASDGGARLAQIADQVLGTQQDRQERSFAVYISEEAFGDAVIRATNKGSARGRLGRQALPAGFIGGG